MYTIHSILHNIIQYTCPAFGFVFSKCIDHFLLTNVVLIGIYNILTVLNAGYNISTCLKYLTQYDPHILIYLLV